MFLQYSKNITMCQVRTNLLPYKRNSLYTLTLICFNRMGMTLTSIQASIHYGRGLLNWFCNWPIKKNSFAIFLVIFQVVIAKLFFINVEDIRYNRQLFLYFWFLKILFFHLYRINPTVLDNLTLFYLDFVLFFYIYLCVSFFIKPFTKLFLKV